MVADAIPSLYPEITESVTPPGKGKHAYFKRARDGWIVTHGAWPSAMSDMAFKGAIHMPQFGMFEMPGPGKGSTVRDHRGVPFNPSEEPWRLILQHQDGAAAFPVAQIIAYRWHIRPPYREVHFPQLEGTKVYDFFCPECDKGVFSSTVEKDAADMLRQHLISRINAQHSYRPEDLKALGEEIGVDFFAARRRGSRATVRGSGESLEPPEPAKEMQADEKFICPECKGEFESGRALQAHRKTHAAVPA